MVILLYVTNVYDLPSLSLQYTFSTLPPSFYFSLQISLPEFLPRPSVSFMAARTHVRQPFALAYVDAALPGHNGWACSPGEGVGAVVHDGGVVIGKAEVGGEAVSFLRKKKREHK